MALEYPPTHIGGHRLDSADFALRWPSDLFADEARAVLLDSDTDRQELLLEEAFGGPVPADALRRASMNGVNQRRNVVLDALLANVNVLRNQAARRPYYSQRAHMSDRTAAVDPLLELIAQLVPLIEDLRQRGYFDHLLAPLPCVDDGHGIRSYEEAASAQLEQELRAGLSWPLTSSQLLQVGRSAVCDVIEVLHDRIARPRHRWEHAFSDCGWHYGEFAIEPGRRLYRWRLNQILDSGDLGLRLADDGEDVGRLVSTTDEARTELLQRMVRRTDPDLMTAGRVQHAISLFRRRHATDEDKRSAIAALYSVVEPHRRLFKAAPLADADDYFFSFADKFFIRHGKGQQWRNYNGAYLDYLFWWYLACVELMDRLLSDGTPS